MIRMEQVPTEPSRLANEHFKCEPLDFSLVSNRSTSSTSSTSEGMYDPKSRKVTFSVHLDTPTPSPETYVDTSKDRESPPFSLHLQTKRQSKVSGLSSPHAAAPISHLGAGQRQQYSPNSTAATALSYPSAALHVNATNPLTGNRLGQIPSPNSMAILQAILESRTHSHASPTSMAGFHLPAVPAQTATSQLQASGNSPFLAPNFGSSPNNGALNLAAAAAAGLPTQTPPGFLGYFQKEMELSGQQSQQISHPQVPNPALLGPNNPFLQLPVPNLSASQMSSESSSSLNMSDCSNGGGSQKRRPPGKTPEHKKDQAYLEKRAKNNLAAKRSRDAKRMKEEATAIEASKLTLENQHLKNELYASKIELARTKLLLQTLSAQHPQIASSLQQLPNSPLSISLTQPRVALPLAQSQQQQQPSELSPVLSSLPAHFQPSALTLPGIKQENTDSQPSNQQLATFLAENAAALASANAPAMSHAPNGTPLASADPSVLGFLLQYFLENQQAGK